MLTDCHDELSQYFVTTVRHNSLHFFRLQLEDSGVKAECVFLRDVVNLQENRNISLVVTPPYASVPS